MKKIAVDKVRNAVLYIAMSLDGFIAREDGSIDWLFTDQDYGYSDFIKTVDTTLMGRKTFEQVLTFGEFPYKNLKNFVFTHNRKLRIYEGVEFIFESPSQIIPKLKEKFGKKIWVVGGSQIVLDCLEANLIDEFILSIHPIILGKGIPLFSSPTNSIPLKFIKTIEFKTGLIQIYYLKK